MAQNTQDDLPNSKHQRTPRNIAGIWRGNYFKGKHNFQRPRAGAIYRGILSLINHIPDASILSAVAPRTSFLYGNERLEAALYALFQRMRLQCLARDVNAFVFFDQGHPEYRRLYRQAQDYLATGSSHGGWGGAATRNMPLDMFLKDANEKNSKHCYFTQLADLIAFAALLKIRSERNSLAPWQADLNYGNIYDSIPTRYINTQASNTPPRDGIVRL
jgi:hypothetical protein